MAGYYDIDNDSDTDDDKAPPLKYIVYGDELWNTPRPNDPEFPDDKKCGHTIHTQLRRILLHQSTRIHEGTNPTHKVQPMPLPRVHLHRGLECHESILQHNTEVGIKRQGKARPYNRCIVHLTTHMRDMLHEPKPIIP